MQVRIVCTLTHFRDGPQPTRLEQATQLPSFYAEDSVAAANETWARLHADPLFAMKQQEIAARKRVIKNPVLMAAVRQEARLAPSDAVDMIAVISVACGQAGKTVDIVLCRNLFALISPSDVHPNSPK